MLRRKRSEIHVNQERWLVSYADFITLLFAFFVVMYSISQVNESKYRVLSETFVQAFHAPGQLPWVQDGKEPPDASLNPIQVGEPARTTATTAIDLRSEHIGDPSESRPHAEEFAELSELFSERFGDLIRDQLVTVASNELWLQIELRDSILFTSGSADPSPQAQVIFDEIAQILRDYPNPVQVEGHTDNLPIRSQRYPSNWELSSARASAIVKWLASRGVDPVRLSAVGFGEFQPIADNATAEGRARNRRVTLMIAKRALPRPTVTAAEAGSELNAVPAAENAAEIPVPEATSTEAPPTVPTLVQEPEPETAVEDSPVVQQSPAASAVEEPPQPGTALTPVELEDGGLLFTSDPDRRRQ